MAGVELIPGEYGYVILTLVLYCFLNVWMAERVLKARKMYAIFSIQIISAGKKMAGIEHLVLEGYGYVVLTLVFYCFFNFWMAFQVGKARKK
ncbi:hypothetical protein C3L33_01787, partial [Rhododendron williamsianum]